MSLFLRHLRAIGDLELKHHIPLSKLTSLKVGGLPLALATVHTPKVLSQLVEMCRSEGVPVHFLGGGTNLLVSDNIASHLILRLGPKIASESVSVDGDFLRVSVPSSKSLASLVSLVKSQGAVGYASLSGIPGTVGGAVAMNAGTKNGDVSQFLESVAVAGPDGEGVLTRDDLNFSYRIATLPQGTVVVGATFRFPMGSAVAIEREATTYLASLAHRKSTQPKGASAGCTFINPPQAPAGALIDQCGLKGSHEGDARVSSVHANFIVNEGQATSLDVLRLISRVQEEVRGRFGVTLTPEIRFLGDFEAATLPVGAKWVEDLSQCPSCAKQMPFTRGHLPTKFL